MGFLGIVGDMCYSNPPAQKKTDSYHMTLTGCLQKALGLPTWHSGPLLRVNPLGTYNRNIRKSQRVKGLRSKLSPKGLPTTSRCVRNLLF